LYTKFFIIVSNGLIVGSLFYGQPNTTEGAFSRGGTAFFSILFLGWLQLSELMKAISGRVVIARHAEYAFYRPCAVSLAQVIHHHYVFFDQPRRECVKVLDLPALRLHCNTLHNGFVPHVRGIITDYRRCSKIPWHGTKPAYHLHWLRHTQTHPTGSEDMVWMALVQQSSVICV